MFSLCSAMKWANLPVTGGLYDQDPMLLDGFRQIFAAQADHQAQEEKRRAERQKRNSKKR